MNAQRIGVTLRSVYTNTIKTFKKSPSVLIPFITLAIFEFAVLTVIYFIPRSPLRAVLGPPVRTFWGERFLHFPTNFLLYPKLLSLSKMGLTIFIGSLLTGAAVAIVTSFYHKKKVRLGAAFMAAFKKYISLFIVIFIFTLLFYVMNKAAFIGLVKYFRAGHDKLLFIKPQLWLGPILTCLNFLLAILIQSAFVYAIPIIINETANPVKSILRSFVLFRRFFFKTLVLVSLPMLIYIPKIILDMNFSFLMNKFFPEVVIIFSALGIVLVTLVIDPMITICATLLYLEQREEK